MVKTQFSLQRPLERREIMSKSHHSMKQEKKKPMMTAKEKRTAKRMKKQREHEHEHELVPPQPPTVH
jgi:hypothetical protein